MRNKSQTFFLSSLVYAFGVLLFIANEQPFTVKADTNHVVISQIQLSGASASDEFVELFNPTDSPIDVAKWRIIRKTSTGSSSQNLVASLSGTIAPRSYFLIAHPAAVASTMADMVYSSSSSGMTTNNTVTLYSDAGVTVVDKVGMGTATDIETAAFTDNPEGGESIVRKATTTSTAQSLFTAGAEATLGNGFDTDNNASDFVLFTTSLPRNSSTTATQPSTTPVVTITPTPSITTTPVPSATVTPNPTSIPTPTVPQTTATPTIVPTVHPTSVPTPTKTPTPTPTAIPTTAPTNTPVPTTIPSPTATIVPTATTTPTPSVLPTAIPTPTVTPPSQGPQIIVNEPLFKNRRLVCVQTMRTIKIFNHQFSMPKISCSIVRI